MKILMFDRGVISSLYGWAFVQAGHQVDFYVKPGLRAEYGDSLGLELMDARFQARGTYIEETFPTKLREDLPVDHDYDLIIVSVRHDRFAEAAEFLGFRSGNATVLVFQNIWTDPESAAAKIPSDRLAWGYPAAGGCFDDNGVLQGALLANVHFGTFGTEPSVRELSVRNLFREAGFKPQEHRDFRGWLWLQFVVNAGMNAQALKAGSPEELVGSPVHLKEAILNVRELLPLLSTRGVDLGAFGTEVAPYRFPAWLGGWILQNTIRSTEPVRLIMELYDDEDEAKLICQDVLAEARRLKISVPRLEDREGWFKES